MNSYTSQQLSVLHLIDSGGMYGAESVVVNLASEMKKMGHLGVVGCLKYGGKPVPELGNVGLEKGLSVAFFQLENKMDLRVVKKVRDYCVGNGIQLIHSHGYKTSIICSIVQMIYGIPYVVTCHLWNIEDFKHRLYIYLESLAMQRAKKVIGVSEEIKKDLLKANVPQRLIQVVRNGIDISFYDIPRNFSKSDFKRSLGIHEDSKIIANIGRLTEQKDQVTLLKGAQIVADRIDNVEFIIVGEGHLRKNLEELSVTLGIRNKVHFLGFRKDIGAILEISDVFVLTSLNEGLPIVLLEAMGKKVPVVTTGVGEISKIIEDGVNGIIIPASDPITFSNKVVNILADLPMSLKLTDNAYKTLVTYYTSKSMTKEYVNIYHEIFNN